jgi:predicted signal transduction protein with EAL and GGDEF domain
MSASIGISTFPEDGKDAETLLKNADIAMYRAKDQGRNNYQFYSAQMNKHTFERLAMESSLRRAIERDEFLLHYQPKLDLRTGAIAGVEALIRWKHPDWGMVSPAQFIPLAEETGLIVQIGEWVLKTACDQSREWRDQGIPPMRVAVNLSARQFSQKTLVSDVARTISERSDPGLPRAGNHRKPGDAQPRGCGRDAAQAEGHGDHPLDRRFRHRVFLARVFEAIPDRLRQDRPLLHQGHSD